MTDKHQTAADIEMVIRHNIDPFVRIRFVTAATSLSRSTIYRLVALGKFPQPCHPSVNITAWRLSEVRAWLDEREQQAPSRIRRL
jgi:prophage regulatory protein